MSNYKVGYFVGSLAKGPINRRLAKALVRLAPDDLEMTEIPFGDLPLYSYDYDADFPPAGQALKDAIAQVDAVRPAIDILHTVFELRGSPMLGTRCLGGRCRCRHSGAARI